MIILNLICRFSTAQRVIYQSVLNVQKACIELCRPGTTLDAIYSAMALLLHHELFSNGIVKEKPDKKNMYEVRLMQFCSLRSLVRLPTAPFYKLNNARPNFFFHFSLSLLST